MHHSFQQLKWILAIALVTTSGCSLTSGNLANKSSDSGIRNADASDAADSGFVRTADAQSADGDADGPPSQPGVKQKGGSRKKLAGWLKKVEPKRESIPLDRTDSNRDDDDSIADAGSDWWKHNEAPATGDESRSTKLNKSRDKEASPFDQ